MVHYVSNVEENPDFKFVALVPYTNPVPKYPKDEPLVYNHRRRLPPGIYRDNYSYAMNYYQPMLNHVESSKTKKEKSPPPHLPWICERGYPKYDTKRPIKRLEEPSEVERIAQKAKKDCRVHLENYRSDIKRSLFSVRNTAIATRIDKHLEDVSFMERMEKRLKERNEEVKKLLEKEREKRVKVIEQKLKVAYEETEFDFSPSVKEAMRGKNEKKIAKILWHDSLVRQLQSNWLHEDAVKAYEERKRLMTEKYPELFSSSSTSSSATTTSKAKWMQKNYDNSVAIIKEALNEYKRQIREINECKSDGDK